MDSYYDIVSALPWRNQKDGRPSGLGGLTSCEPDARKSNKKIYTKPNQSQGNKYSSDQTAHRLPSYSSPSKNAALFTLSFRSPAGS
eukprot:scaffold24788_cov117-Cylindrotheca_fusiformis.AAC.1